jgi:cytochrome P450
MGLPLLGETLAFGQNPFRFLEDRRKRHGNVFKSSLFGRKIVFLAGTEGAQAFYDAQNISRADAHPFPLVKLFGGINMEMYDGPRHFALKSMALQAFDHAAIEGYLPDMQRLIEAKLAQLTQAGEFSAIAELRRLAIEVICGNVLGLAPGPQTEAMTRDYGIVVPGLIALPLPLPGTTGCSGASAPPLRSAAGGPAPTRYRACSPPRPRMGAATPTRKRCSRCTTW